MAIQLPDRIDTLYGDNVDSRYLLASAGQLPGVEIWSMIGDNDAISSTPLNVMWHLDNTIGNTGIFQASSVMCYASSASALDVGDVLRVIALDANYNRVELGVILNGINGVALAVPVLRILYAELVTGQLSADVYFGTEASPALGVPALINTMNYIHAIHNTTHLAAYTVPAGYTLFIDYFQAGSNKNDELKFTGLYRPFGYDQFLLSIPINSYRAINTAKVPSFKFSEKTDIYVAAISGAGNAAGACYVYGLLVKNQYVNN